MVVPGWFGFPGIRDREGAHVVGRSSFGLAIPDVCLPCDATVERVPGWTGRTGDMFTINAVLWQGKRTPMIR